jgi:hypothetical protein
MKYAVEMGSDAMTNIKSSIKICSGIQKFIGGIHIYRHRQQGDLIRLPLFFQN